VRLPPACLTSITGAAVDGVLSAALGGPEGNADLGRAAEAQSQ
jgi:hypothetical protein